MASISWGNSLLLTQYVIANTSSAAAISTVTGMVLDGTGDMIGYRYIPSTTSPITAVDIRVALTGTSPTFVVGVYAESTSTAEIPDTATPTQLGTDTPGFTWAATGWSGLQTLGSNTGNLTINTPVWIVIKYSSGTIDGSNNIQANGRGAMILPGVLRHYNGSSWTVTSRQPVVPNIVIKHNDGTYAGFPITAVNAASSAAAIYVNGGTTQVQGIRLKCGAQMKIIGVAFKLTKAGTPNALTWTVYEGDTSKYSETIANQIYILNQEWSAMYFQSPVFLAADTNYYIIASQTGTSGSATYDMWVYTVDATYISAAEAPDMAFVSGNMGTPSGLTVSTTEIPLIFPILYDPAAEFDSASGGGLLTHPGMSGGMRG